MDFKTLHLRSKTYENNNLPHTPSEETETLRKAKNIMEMSTPERKNKQHINVDNNAATQQSNNFEQHSQIDRATYPLLTELLARMNANATTSVPLTERQTNVNNENKWHNPDKNEVSPVKQKKFENVNNVTLEKSNVTKNNVDSKSNLDNIRESDANVERRIGLTNIDKLTMKAAEIINSTENENSINTVANSKTSENMRHLHEVVCHVSSAQTLHETTLELAERVRVFESKMRNVTQLLELSSEMQAEREDVLFTENVKLKEKIDSQAVAIDRMHEELNTLRECLPIVIEQAIQKQTSKLEQQQREYYEKQVETWEARWNEQAEQHQNELTTLRHIIEELNNELETSKLETPALKSKLNTMQEEEAQTWARYEEEMNEVKGWARRNLEMLKNQVVKVYQDVQQVRGSYESLVNTINQNDCKVQAQWQKLREILRRKTNENSALSALMNKELQLVCEVAKAHNNLSTRKDVDTNYHHKNRNDRDNASKSRKNVLQEQL